MPTPAVTLPVTFGRRSVATLAFETWGSGGQNLGARTEDLAHLGDVPAAVGRYVDLARYGEGLFWVSRSRRCRRRKARRLAIFDEVKTVLAWDGR